MAVTVPEGSYAHLSNGMDLHYLEFSPTNVDAPTAVFIHGSGPGASGWSNFKQNTEAFCQAGYRAIIIDIPGYGYTSKPTDAIYSLDFFTQYLDEFMVHKGINRAVLVGNSLGGAIAVGYALEHPDKVSHLILMATGGVEEREVYFATQGIQAMVKYPMGSPEFTKEVLGELLKLLVCDPKHITEQLVNERWKILQMQNPQVLASMQIPNLTDRLPELSVPILGFWGYQDKFCPISGAHTIISQCGDARMNMLSQCGHWVMVEHSAYFNKQCIEFLHGN
ncbi:MAG: alpha/beta fold hydrolase [Porticoccaceae bacterium]|jgi:4,5:9,10-diseco-3-hydroxy-5,9,17-trioxoandrosta-1(10),2-diene-4-oate hydrolase|nr:alpha/beta fold hydrolase [Porticoccaceae bacterium]MBT6799895.1 alpha/beta fold hydrolase [Porticoccaceae bacterium]MBT7167374.1 alpha/beta fold hydrolase [Porticoccaceae bacterium]